MKRVLYNSIVLLTVWVCTAANVMAQEQYDQENAGHDTQQTGLIASEHISNQHGLQFNPAGYSAPAKPVTQPAQSSYSVNTLSQAAVQAEIARKEASLEALKLNNTQKIADLHQRSTHNMLVLGILVSALLMLFLLWGRYDQHRQNQRLVLEVRNRTRELELKNTQLLEANRALEKISMKDALTGLNNRKFLDAHLPGELARTHHYFTSRYTSEYQPGNDLLAYLIDIDHFKQINDEYGHLAGDRVLVQFTAVLKQVFRETDLVIRWGGEEFLIICRQADRTQAVDVANRILEAVRQKRFYLPDHSHIHMTCSIGFSALPVCRQHAESIDWETAFSLIDYCLYAAKISQRDCWVGVSDARAEGMPTDEQLPLLERFGIRGADVKTSLNNIASIYWPD